MGAAPIRHRFHQDAFTRHRQVDGDREIVLRREEFTLRGKGWISFGQSKTTATDILEFYCE